MYIHKEGRKLLLSVALVSAAMDIPMLLLVEDWTFFHVFFMALPLLLWCFFLFFFRIPRRDLHKDSQTFIAPADGVICAIEETFVKEYLDCEALQISIFMSATNVHVNRYPADGTVEYVKYHKGNYFMAAYPKSSTLNEHSSVGMLLANGQRILLRQVAGVMARRIVCYAQEGQQVKQNDEMGFIKFGSRVDLFVPMGTPLCVEMQEAVRNGITPLALLQ